LEVFENIDTPAFTLKEVICPTTYWKEPWGAAFSICMTLSRTVPVPVSMKYSGSKFLKPSGASRSILFVCWVFNLSS
jgi:hypothetical protein